MLQFGRCAAPILSLSCADFLNLSAHPTHPPSLLPSHPSAWIYDRDPFQPMRWQDDLEKFKGRLQRGEDVFGERVLK